VVPSGAGKDCGYLHPPSGVQISAMMRTRTYGRHQQQQDVVAAAVADVLVQPGDQDVEQGSAIGPGAADRVRGDLGQREEPAVRVSGLGDPSVYSSSWSPSPTGIVLARHHPSARSSNPSGGAAYGSMNAAEWSRSSSGGGCPQQTSSAQDPAGGAPPSDSTREVHQQRGDEPPRVPGPGDQRVQPDRDASQARLRAGQVTPGVQHRQASPVGGQAGTHDVADEQPDAERRGHHVVDIAASALGGGQMARFDIQPTDMCRGRPGRPPAG
jgi:hypothetical protein